MGFVVGFQCAFKALKCRKLHRFAPPPAPTPTPTAYGGRPPPPPPPMSSPKSGDLPTSLQFYIYVAQGRGNDFFSWGGGGGQSVDMPIVIAKF